MELKDTLLMPKTNFEMRGNLNQKEPIIQQRWNELHLYEEMLKKNEGKPTFLLHDGPPYANGDIHVGHALNKSIKDFIVRFKTMDGYKTPFIPGWDTHGLPIESALQKLGVNRKTMTTAEFRQKCHDYALTQIARQKSQMIRLGTLGDYDHPYETLDPRFEGRQIEVFAAMALKGLIYKGKKPVYWSPSSESALAEAEIEYEDVKSSSIYVAFKVTQATPDSTLQGDESIVIWTTTPWTIPANLAISVHPDFDYGVFESDQGVFLFLKEHGEKLSHEFNLTHVNLRKVIKGKLLEGVLTKHPFYDRTSIVIVGEHVTADAGSGCVHTAPGHGEEDFLIGQKYHLDLLCPVDSKGFMTQEAGADLAGVFYEDANAIVLKKLSELGALLKSETFTHSYPHDWRTKKPVIYRVTDQWFASIQPIRKQLLDEIKKVHWIPSWGEIRLANMISDRGDWCISRQRSWGVPIPIIYNEDDTPIIEAKVFEHIANLFRTQGSNCWFQLAVNELLPKGYTNVHSPHGHFRKETDIMDVWFDSGSSHTGVLLERGLGHPSDLYFEGSDQYRGWFNSSLIISTAVWGHAPYKNVVSHGFILDGQGNKMSKSLGNTIDPNKVIEQYGADVLRLWIALSDYQSDVRISMDLIKQVSESYRKIRNTFRFLLGNLSHGNLGMFNPKTESVDQFEMVDQWILGSLEQLVETSVTAYRNYDFATVTQSILNFMANDLSSFYLDITKDILYCESPQSLRRRQVQTVIYRCLTSMLPLITPILPHTAEEIYDNSPNKVLPSAQLLEMPKISHEFTATLVDYQMFLELRNDVLKAIEESRATGKVGSAQEVQLHLEIHKDSIKNLFNKLPAVEQRRLFIVSEIVQGPLQNGKKYSVSSIEVSSHHGHKCERCWNYVDTPKQVNPTLCSRCHEAVQKYE